MNACPCDVHPTIHVEYSSNTIFHSQEAHCRLCKPKWSPLEVIHPQGMASTYSLQTPYHWKGTFQIFTLLIATLQMAYTHWKSEHQPQWIGNISCHGSSPHMAIIPLIHSIHRFCLRVRSVIRNGRELVHYVIIDLRWKVVHLNCRDCVRTLLGKQQASQAWLA